MSRRAMSRLFSVGLALATTRCASEPRGAADSPQATSPASVSGAPSSAPEPSASASSAPKASAVEELAARLKKIDAPTSADGDVEYLGFVAARDGKLVCEHEPCPKEWAPLVKQANVSHLVARKKDKLVAVTQESFVAVLGPIDTPIAAVMLARLAGKRLASCDHHGKIMRCRPAGDGSGLVDTASTEGFDLAIHTPFRCPTGDAPGPGLSLDLAFIHVAGDGRISAPRHPLAARADAEMSSRGGVRCQPPRMRGRRFEGYRDVATERSVLDYLLRAHDEESAAAIAFDRLADELVRFGAPVALAKRARRAAADERRHSAVFLAEARSCAARAKLELGFGVADVEPFMQRSLEAMLLENAVEGCASETCAAIVATYQAASWPDPRMRPALEGVAADERDHAQLAYDVHAWGQTKLDGVAVAGIDEARVQALARAWQASPSPFARAMGEPDAALVAIAAQHVTARLTRLAHAA